MKHRLRSAMIAAVALGGAILTSGASAQGGAPTNQVAQANGIQMRYVRAGTGPKAVVLLHGWPQHSLMWERITPALVRAGYTVIAPDMRGAGGSTITAGGYDKATMAEDVRALVKGLGFERVQLVGYDLGGGVAYTWAAKYPREVERLVIAEFAIPGAGAYEQSMQPSPEWTLGSNWHLSFFTVPDAAEFAFRGRERELLSWFFWHISCDPGAVRPGDFEEYARQVAKPGALRAGINYYATVWQDIENNKPLLARKLPMPVLAVGGQCSGGDGIAKAMAPLASNVRSAVIPNAGHWLADENPEAFARELVSFFASDERGRAGATPTLSPAVSGDAGIQEKIRRLDAARVRAWLNEDATALDRLYTADYTIVLPEGTVQTRAEALAAFRDGRTIYDAISVEDVSVRVHGDSAIWSGLITSRGRFGGRASSGTFRVTNIYVRQGGTWLLGSQHVTTLATM